MTKSYRYIMSEWLSHPDCSLYALVDGLQFERYFGYEIGAEKGVVYPFFTTYPDSKIAFAGPWLFRLNCSEEYRRKLAELEAKYPSVSWLLSSLTPDKLLLKFRGFSTIELPSGSCGFFRFYDPRVLRNLASWLEISEYFRLVNDVSRWVFIVNDEFFDLKTGLDKYV